MRGLWIERSLNGKKKEKIEKEIGKEIVDIGRKKEMRKREWGRKEEDDVLKDGGKRVIGRLGKGIEVKIGVGKGLDRKIGRKRRMRDIEKELMERVVEGKEVGLGIELKEKGIVEGRRKKEKKLGRSEERIIVGIGDEIGEKKVKGRLDIEIGRRERRIEVNNKREGEVEELFEERWGNDNCVEFNEREGKKDGCEKF